MMISPGAAYEFELKDKSKEGIEKEIKSVKRNITKLKREIREENMFPECKPSVLPGKDTYLSWDREYLDVLKNKLSELGYEYKLNSHELKVAHINDSIQYLKRIVLEVESRMLLEKKEVEIIGEDIVVKIYGAGAVLLREVKLEDSAKDFIYSLQRLYLGEWKKHYKVPKGYGVVDGEFWKLTLSFNNEQPDFIRTGESEFPYNYEELVGILEELETEAEYEEI